MVKTAKPTKSKIEERVFFETKYGPITVRRNGVELKELVAPGNQPNADATKHKFDNLFISMHIERYEAPDNFSETVECVVRLPETGYEARFKSSCEMRIGQTHGAAAFQVKDIAVSLDKDAALELEYLRGDQSLTKVLIPIKYPNGPKAENDGMPNQVQHSTM